RHGCVGATADYVIEDPCSPAVKYEERRQHHKSKSDGVVPAKFFAEEPYGEDREHRQGDDLLNRLQLCGAEFVRTDAIRRHLKTVLEKGDAPTRQHNLPKRFAAIFQMAVPRKSHEHV